MHNNKLESNNNPDDYFVAAIKKNTEESHVDSSKERTSKESLNSQEDREKSLTALEEMITFARKNLPTRLIKKITEHANSLIDLFYADRMRSTKNLLEETSKQIELKQTTITKLENIEMGISQVYMATLKNGKKAVIKPVSGEQTVKAMYTEGVHRAEAGDFYRREQASYEVAKAFGMGGLLPSVTMRKINNTDLKDVDPKIAKKLIGENCSVQEFAKNDGNINDFDDVRRYFTEKQQISFRQSENDMRILDIITWNADRHNGNWLFKENKKTDTVKIIPIDHGLTMAKQAIHHTYKNFDMPDDIVFENINEKTKKYIIAFSDSKESQNILKQKLQKTLNHDNISEKKRNKNNEEIDALIWRAINIGEKLHNEKSIKPGEITYSENYANLKYAVLPEIANLHKESTIYTKLQKNTEFQKNQIATDLSIDEETKKKRSDLLKASFNKATSNYVELIKVAEKIELVSLQPTS